MYLSLQGDGHKSKWKPWSVFRWDSDDNGTPTGTLFNPQLAQAYVENIIQEYDFLIITEELDLSLVVMSMLLYGPDMDDRYLGDLITVSSKVHGSYFFKHEVCHPLASSFRSESVQEYLESDTWYAQNYGDYLLHATAKASMERTIDELGRDKVERNLEELQRLKALVYDFCAEKVVPKCSKTGEVQENPSKCYKKDWGCGYECVDEALRNLS